MPDMPGMPVAPPHGEWPLSTVPAAELMLHQAAFYLYLAAAGAYIVYVAARGRRVGQAATGIALLGLAANTAALVVRTVAAGRVPYVTLYEYLMAFGWAVAAFYLIVEWRSAAARSDLRPVGSLALLLAAGLLGYASRLDPVLKEADTLLPVLKSNWLIFHVLTGVVGYGAAGVAAAIAVLYLLRRRWPGSDTWLRRLPAPAELDLAAYRAVVFAFPFLALLNITGAIWAYDAWGRYWGWDPKETWSLIMWLVYVFYLHARLRPAWRGARANWMVIIGFAVVMFTFLGVNMLQAFKDSLHSYAG